MNHWEDVSPSILKGFRSSHHHLKKVELDDIAYCDDWNEYEDENGQENTVSFKVYACTPELSKVLKKAMREIIEKDMKKEGDTFEIKRRYCYVPPQ